ncbi:MAG: multicopper oxidase family protein [Thiobacillus sp.]|nr:multicopper oxidase family protein [Thiobacillus sp.]
MKRRQFLNLSAASGLGLLGLTPLFRHTADADAARVSPAQPSGAMAPRRTPLRIPGDSGVMGVIDMTDETLPFKAEKISLALIDGKPSPFLTYSARYGGRDYQNPIIRIRHGQQFTASLHNQLNEPNIIHWHGLHVPAAMDGQPRTTLDPGGRFDYTYRVTNRSGMYWYHTHAHHRTAPQVYFGLTGLYMVEDEDEIRLRRALDLEPGTTELPLVIQDRQFNAAGELVYETNAMQHHMGQLGDVILVNLTPNATLTLARRMYRFRVLNGSNARVYKLAFVADGKKLPYQLIGTDAGLLERAYTAHEEYLSPAERMDILFDASALPPGQTVRLMSLAFDPLQGGLMAGMGPMMGGMSGMGGKNAITLDLGAEFEIMSLVVDERAAAPAKPAPRQAVPDRLSTIQRTPVNGAIVKKVRITVENMHWLINGETFHMDRFPLKSKRNTVEIWDIENAEMSMPHPMHMHGFSFQVVERRNSPAHVRLLAKDPQGRQITDLGWKDTVMVWPGETVRIVADFTHPYAGDQLYLFHCHILEHEDQGMMVNHLVTNS